MGKLNLSKIFSQGGMVAVAATLAGLEMGGLSPVLGSLGSVSLVLVLQFLYARLCSEKNGGVKTALYRRGVCVFLALLFSLSSTSRMNREGELGQIKNLSLDASLSQKNLADTRQKLSATEYEVESLAAEIATLQNLAAVSSFSPEQIGEMKAEVSRLHRESSVRAKLENLNNTSSIQAAQAALGLRPDGKLGEETLAAVKNALAGFKDSRFGSVNDIENDLLADSKAVEDRIRKTSELAGLHAKLAAKTASAKALQKEVEDLATSNLELTKKADLDKETQHGLSENAYLIASRIAIAENVDETASLLLHGFWFLIGYLAQGSYRLLNSLTKPEKKSDSQLATPEECRLAISSLGFPDSIAAKPIAAKKPIAEKPVRKSMLLLGLCFFFSTSILTTSCSVVGDGSRQNPYRVAPWIINPDIIPPQSQPGLAPQNPFIPNDVELPPLAWPSKPVVE